MNEKKEIYNVTSGELTETFLNNEEIAQQELDSLAWEEEESKPKPPTEQERIQALEDVILMLTLGGM